MVKGGDVRLGWGDAMRKSARASITARTGAVAATTINVRVLVATKRGAAWRWCSVHLRRCMSSLCTAVLRRRHDQHLSTASPYPWLMALE